MRFLAQVLLSGVLVALAGDSAYSQQGVNYRGRIYYSRVCSNPNCSMCNRIEAGLRQQQLSWYATPKAMAPAVPRERVQARSEGSDRLTDTTLEPSPQIAVRAMLDIVKPAPGELLMDLGSGDGRILIEAGLRGVRAKGLELNPNSVALSRQRIAQQGLSGLCTVQQADLTKVPSIEASVVTMYLFPELIDAIWPKIKPGTLVVSYSHPLPSASMRVERTLSDGHTHVFYVRVKRRTD